MRRPWTVIRYIRQGQRLRLKRILRWQKGFAYPFQNFNCPFLGHVYLFWFILIMSSIVEIYYDPFCKIRSTSLNKSLNVSLKILKYIKLIRVTHLYIYTMIYFLVNIDDIESCDCIPAYSLWIRDCYDE